MSTARIDGTKYLRLHHFGFPTRDAVATREFYEDILGLPMSACWIEVMEEDGQRFWGMHMYFELSDGSVLGFTAFDRELDAARYCSDVSQFVHVAIKVDESHQADIVQRLRSRGYTVETFYHGYCMSVYVKDPNNLCIELTQDTAVKENAFCQQRLNADRYFRDWVSGLRIDNNPWRESLELAPGA